jgi:hypothetical protein
VTNPLEDGPVEQDYRATPKQWAFLEELADRSSDAESACIRELRARVEALEAAQQPIHSSASAEQQARDLLERMGIESAQDLRAGDLTELANLIAAQSAPAPAGSLVERLWDAIDRVHGRGDEAEAHAAIRLIAGELRAQCFVHAADWLEQEADRG